MNLELALVLSIIFVVIVLVGLLFAIKSRKNKKNISLEYGSLFDSYEIRSFIKRGGMASVYEAINVKTKEKVALKIMHESLMDDLDLVDKFLMEGDILEKLNRKYPSAPIVKVFRHSRENNDINGRPFIALELVDGIDLDTLLVNSKLNLDQSVFIIEKILYALKSAHSEGILHRDISPGNVMVNFDNGQTINVKMIDFGVAKNEYMNKNTPDSSIHGKPPFMSPEQCRNEKLDKRSDIYSLGILFYTLIMGQPPYNSKNPLEVMSMHQTGKYPPLPDNIPKAIRKIIDNLLEKDIISRYQSAEEVLQDLHQEKLIVDHFTTQNQNLELGSNGLIEDVSGVYNSNKIQTLKPKKKSTSLVLLIGILLSSIIIIGYVLIQDITPQSSKVYIKKGESMNSALTKLRNYNLKLNYVFDNSLNQSSHFIDPVIKNTIIIDTKNPILKSNLKIVIGTRNDN